MAVDKLVDSAQLDADLTSVANAIRTKGGTSASLAFPAGFVSAVEAIPTGGGDPNENFSKLMNGTLTVAEDATATVITAYRLDSITSLTTVNFPNVTRLDSFAIGHNRNLVTVNLPKLDTLGTEALSQCTKLPMVTFPVLSTLGAGFKRCSLLATVDLGKPSKIPSYTFEYCSVFATLIIRRSTLCTLDNVSAFNSTPFASSGAGGTLYVPSALISSYQAATNWSTILGYANNNIQAIEGSQYENYYADGTPVT